ncbi:VOC family protein [Sporosarcina sp. HYO08]|uniref:VOC family protein n=1 Tax=Sporosarcina sp. HYO08 TaxID=1759557 RepID=UPI00079A8C93|nr:VOC family protein [Sporosarcina sp. HYO08]KXH80900.1 hypothetical protein AU377_09210 [Sporosarcina sp. HYO08]
MKLDHVVYFTKKDPKTIVAEKLAEKEHAVVGGRHENWGTQNALRYVGNAYMEWLSVEREDVAKKAQHPLVDLLLHDVKDGEGWGTICLSVTNIEALKEDIENKGFQTSGVLDASRKTANGELRKWKMLFVDQSVSDELPYPFFIEWEQEEEQRFAMLRKEGTISPYDEQKQIVECQFHVHDPLGTTGEWAVLLSQKVGDQHDIVLPNVTLTFIEKEDGKERLADVKIQ